MVMIPRNLVEVDNLKLQISTLEKSFNSLLREEIGLMLETLKCFPQEFRLMTHLGLYSGLRLSEVLAFPDHIVRRPELGEESVFADITTSLGKNSVCIKTVAIPGVLMTELYRFRIRHMRQQRMEIKGNPHPYRPFFLDERGRVFTERWVVKLWSDLRLRIEKSSGHTFSHHFADLRLSYRLDVLRSLLDQTGSSSERTELESVTKYLDNCDIQNASANFRFLEKALEKVKTSGINPSTGG